MVFLETIEQNASAWLVPALLAAVLLQPDLLGLVTRFGCLWRRRSMIRFVWVYGLKAYQRRAVPHSQGLKGAIVAEGSPNRWRAKAPGVYCDIALCVVFAIMLSCAWVPSGHALVTDFLLGLVLALLAITDLRWFWLPDRLTLPLWAIGLLAAWLDGNGLVSLVGSLLGGGLFLGLRCAYLFARGRHGLGMGDVKLAAAMGAWLRPERILDAVVIAALLGCAFAVVQMLTRRRGWPQSQRLPFGPCLVLAMWIEWMFPSIGGWPIS